MFRTCKTGQNLSPAGTDVDMVALFSKSTFFLLFFASQCHLILASPYLFPGADHVGSISTSSQTSSTIAYYNNFRFHNPFYRFPTIPWPFSTSHFHHHGPTSSPSHQLPTPVPHPPIPNALPAPQIPHAGPHPPESDDMIRVFLSEHNKVRSSYGAPELVWNPALVPAAKRVTDTCIFKHTANNQYGENIAAGQTSPQQVVTQWVSGPEEKSAYDPNAPRDSHFTQVVWHGTREVGCAVTSCTTLTGASLPQSPIQFWACEYNPPGNVETLYLKNVHATAGGAPLKS